MDLDWDISFNSFLACGDISPLLVTFANSLDPDVDRKSVGPDLDPNCLRLRFLKKKLKKFILKKVSRQQQIVKNYPACNKLNKRQGFIKGCKMDLDCDISLNFNSCWTFTLLHGIFLFIPFITCPLSLKLIAQASVLKLLHLL